MNVADIHPEGQELPLPVGPPPDEGWAFIIFIRQQAIPATNGTTHETRIGDRAYSTMARLAGIRTCLANTWTLLAGTERKIDGFSTIA